MASLNYKHLRYFWMVAKCGAIARACEQLHLTPQAVSGQLRELEESLGVELFRRVGRGLELTDAGGASSATPTRYSPLVMNCWKLLATRR
jgi:LysR family transcriptional activator of nhaA